jgi:type VI secretion system secreted protein Hcp
MFKAFLKIEGIDGESKDQSHDKWIDILSYSHGIEQTGSDQAGGRRRAGQSTHEDFIVIKGLDKASPKLALARCSGQHIPKVVLELCQSGDAGQKFMEYELKNVMVTAVYPRGDIDGPDERPTEEIAFNYEEIKFVYTIFDPQSGASAGYVQTQWDVKENKER